MESRSARCVRDVDWLHRCGQFWKGRKRREGAYEGPGHPRHFTDDFKRQIVDLSNGEYGKAKGKHAELIDEKMASINRCFPVLHQASVARAAIYCEQGEVKAMASALEAYSRLIGQTVGSRAGLLAEFDVSDDGTDRGVWRSGAALQLDVSALSKALSAPEKTFYLEAITDEKEAEDELG